MNLTKLVSLLALPLAALVQLGLILPPAVSDH
jgi:hypothetical protein